MALDLTWAPKHVGRAYCAGQVNGSSGYEEAAAQGLFAGINCGLWLRGEPPLLLSRSDGYMGVLVDDLATRAPTSPIG